MIMTNSILVIGFLVIAILLWEVVKSLGDIAFWSKESHDQLSEIKNNPNLGSGSVDLRGRKLVDLSDLGDSLKKIHDKLGDIESSIYDIKDQETNL